MKYRLLTSLICLGCSLAFGADLSEELEDLKDDRDGQVRIGTVNDDTIRTDDDEKIEVLKFSTFQGQSDELTYRIRVTLELTDNRGKGDVYFAQLQREQGPIPIDSPDQVYLGTDSWEFQIPHGELKKPKLTAYTIEYGFFKDGVFVPVAEEFKKVDSADEIKDRADHRLDLQITKHTYQYRDASGAEQTSPSNHKNLK